MSRAGEEMVLELASLLDNGVVKTAAKKKDEEKEDKKEGKEPEAGEKKEEKEADKDKKKKKEKDAKASIMVHVLRDLVKLAGELDELGADEASDLVDEALRVITESLSE